MFSHISKSCIFNRLKLHMDRQEATTKEVQVGAGTTSKEAAAVEVDTVSKAAAVEEDTISKVEAVAVEDTVSRVEAAVVVEDTIRAAAVEVDIIRVVDTIKAVEAADMAVVVVEEEEVAHQAEDTEDVSQSLMCNDQSFDVKLWFFFFSLHFFSRCLLVDLPEWTMLIDMLCNPWVNLLLCLIFLVSVVCVVC